VQGHHPYNGMILIPKAAEIQKVVNAKTKSSLPDDAIFLEAWGIIDSA
jgi:hypothetical protein